MKTEPIHTTEGWEAILTVGGSSLNSLNAAMVGCVKGLVVWSRPDAEILAELRGLATAHDRLTERS